jgi:hypothetical protein
LDCSLLLQEVRWSLLWNSLGLLVTKSFLREVFVIFPMERLCRFISHRVVWPTQGKFFSLLNTCEGRSGVKWYSAEICSVKLWWERGAGWVISRCVFCDAPHLGLTVKYRSFCSAFLSGWELGMYVDLGSW